MGQFEVLLLIFSTTAVLIVIGLLLSLAIIGKFKQLSHGLSQIYGEEHDIKKRIEQYVSRKTSDELSKLMDTYGQILDEQSKQVVSSMQQGAKSHLESMEKFIREQEGLITRQTEYIVGAIVKKAQDDIETYKQNQLEGVDAAVKEIVERIAPEVLGKSLSFSEHEEFVWKALEDAKKQGIFQSELAAAAHTPQASKVTKLAPATPVKPIPRTQVAKVAKTSKKTQVKNQKPKVKSAIQK